MDVKKVLFVNQGILPYLPESPMTIRGCNVPKGIQESGCQIRTFLPQWGCINERSNRGQ